MNSLNLLQETLKLSISPVFRIYVQFMGGGSARANLGRFNKWKWKRLQNKRSENGTRLLDHEKQKHDAQLRSNIRLKLSGKSVALHSSFGSSSSLKQQVKVLANRFMTDTAVDLWNENDGFTKFPVRKVESAGYTGASCNFFRAPLETKPTSKERSLSNDDKNPLKSFRYNRPRRYSMYTNFGPKTVDTVVGSPWKADILSSSESDSDTQSVSGQRNDIGSSASLRKHDVKFTKRFRLNKFNNEKIDEEEMIGIKQEDCEEGKEKSIFTEKRFDQLKISPITVEALTASGYVQQTNVQASSLPICLSGEDALVKARNGTGKSITFLIPAIETVLNSDNETSQQPFNPIRVLILCPTREIASQLAAETNALLRFHSGIRVQTLVGGTRFKYDLKSLKEHPSQIIIATPGRLLDHIDNRSGLSVNLIGLKLLILDEADRLLDLGCRKDIENITDSLPRQRQTLLFTSTLPREVRRISHLVLNRNHTFIDTIGLKSVETPEQVKQYFTMVPLELQVKTVYHFLRTHIMRTPDYKVIVFYTTGMVTAFMHDLFRRLKMNVREIHHRKPHLCRARVSEEFREAKRIILFTSDVSTRGVNYPDVTLVIQVGMPYDRGHYIHRLGRTARGGKCGEGILLLAPWEEYFLENLKDLPLEKMTPITIDEDIHSKVEGSIERMESSAKEGAWHAWLGYYNSIREIGRDKTSLVQYSLEFCHSVGLQSPPPLFRRTALKMGLKDIPGIKLR